VEVLRRHGEADATRAVAVPHVARGFHELLLERRPRALGVPVKRNQAFRDRGVAQTIRTDQRIDELGRASGAAQRIEIVTAERKLRA
jgi:hypothetical protein